ncbi:MAG: hypothetical protein ACYDCO_04555 [Armatimonadota bacterium]
MNAPQSSPRTKRRRWLVLPALALLLAGGVVAYRVSVGPQLQPAERYHWPDYHGCPLIFSAQGMGYPAIGIVDEKKPGGITVSQPCILDDLCRPLDATGSFLNANSAGTYGNISPTRAVVAWSSRNGSKPGFCVRRRNGHQAFVSYPVSRPHSSSLTIGPIPYSDEVIGCNIYTTAGENRTFLYAPDGRSLPLPAKDLQMPNWIASGDDRLIPFSNGTHLRLYDRTEKKILPGLSFRDQTAMIWRHRDRLLLVPSNGNVVVYDWLRHTQTPLPGTADWHWGEDGTVWTLDGGTLQVLHWRTGTPKLAAVTTRGTPGARYGSLVASGIEPFAENTRPDWAAVWGDGRLVAGVENLAPSDTRLSGIAMRAARALRIKLDIPREARRLTLYRGKRRVGSFLLRTQPMLDPRQAAIAKYSSRGPSVTQETDNHEHLAFTKDGKYLSWAIDDGTGVKLFVFEVPPP